MLGIASLIFSDSPSFALAFVLLVLFSNYILQVQHRPFMSTVEREKELEYHKLKVSEGHPLHIYIEESLTRANDSQTDTRRHVMTKKLTRIDEKKDEKKTDQEQAAEYFFDFNTVELLLLASAILVCVFGIMFEAPTQNESTWDYGLGILTILVISSSLFYYFTVFLSEVVVACGCRMRWMTRLIKAFGTRDLTNGQEDPEEQERSSIGKGGFHIASNPMLFASNDIKKQAEQERLNAERAHAEQAEHLRLQKEEKEEVIKKLREQNAKAKQRLNKGASWNKGATRQSAVLELTELY